MGDPGLFQEHTDILFLLAEGGGDGEQPAAADDAAGRLEAMAVLSLNKRLDAGPVLRRC